MNASERSQLEAIRDEFLERLEHGTTKASIENWQDAADKIIKFLYLESIGYFEDDA
jgi:hypothetical protein